MDLSAALTAYHRVALNLGKLDRVWQRMEELLLDGPFIGIGLDDELTYAQLGAAGLVGTVDAGTALVMSAAAGFERGR